MQALRYRTNTSQSTAEILFIRIDRSLSDFLSAEDPMHYIESKMEELDVDDVGEATLYTTWNPTIFA